MAHVGQTFTHKYFLDPNWKPGPGEKYHDAPHAEMVVTRVKMGSVFYRYAEETEKQRSRGGWTMERWKFEVLYPCGHTDED